MPSILTLALALTALASDEPETPEPDAPPATEESAAPAVEPVADELIRPVTALSAEDALAVRNALREFKQERLQVQRVSDMSLAATQYSATLTLVDTWSVFRGEQRLDTLTYLDRVGAMEDLQTLKQRRKRNTAFGVGSLAVGAVGFGAFLSGLNMMVDLDEARSRRGTGLFVTGLALEAVGIGTGTYLLARNRRLKVYPAHTHTKDQAEDYVNAYNDQLAEDLGLSAQHLLELERGE